MREVGKYSSTNKASSCNACGAGKYSDEEGSECVQILCKRKVCDRGLPIVVNGKFSPNSPLPGLINLIGGGGAVIHTGMNVQVAGHVVIARELESQGFVL